MFLKKNKIWLIFLTVNCIALIVSGARTAQVATLISVVLFIYLQKKYLKNKIIRVGRLLINIFVGYSSTIFLARLFYTDILNSILKSLFSGKRSMSGFDFIKNIIPMQLNEWYEGIKEIPIGIFFGYGPGILKNQLMIASHDLFIIDIVARYGLIGFFFFYFIFFVFTKEMLFSLKKTSSSFKNIDKDKLILSFSIVLLLLITTIHAGALVRKSIYPWLFVAYGIGRRYFFGIYSPIIKKG